MSALIELAKHIRSRDNPSPYTPMFGKIIELPELKIQLGSRILLDKDDVKATFDLYETRQHDGYIEYVNLNKTIVLLPYASDNKFIVIGVVQ